MNIKESAPMRANTTREGVEASSYIISPGINQRVARIGEITTLTATGSAVAGLSLMHALQEKVALPERVAAGTAGTVALAAAISLPVLCYLGDSDFSPHRVTPDDAPDEAKLEVEVTGSNF